MVAPVLLGAGSASFGIGGLAAWVPAVTTVSASLTAHIAESCYDLRALSSSKTAEQLERLGDQVRPGDGRDSVRRCVRGGHLGREPSRRINLSPAAAGAAVMVSESGGSTPFLIAHGVPSYGSY